MIERRKLTGDHCQCSPKGGCGEYFNSTAAFDDHRTGTHGMDRRCLTTDEMVQRGMRLSSTGWWLTRKASKQPRLYVRRSLGTANEENPTYEALSQQSGRRIPPIWRTAAFCRIALG